MKCINCDEKLGDEEAKSPRRDEDSDIMCDDCYHDIYEFTCIKCENYEHINHNGGIGSVFVAFEDDILGIPTGVYEVVSHPFYADGMVEGYLYTDAIKQISNYTFEIKQGWYPMAFLCEECTVKIRKRIEVAKSEDEIPNGELFANLRTAMTEVFLITLFDDDCLVDEFNDRLNRSYKIHDCIKMIMRRKFTHDDIRKFLNSGGST